MLLDVRTVLDNTPQPSDTTARVISTAFNGVAIVITLLRLFVQYRRQRLWWEDLWAAIALVFALVTVVAFWFRTGSATLEPYPSRMARIVTFWLAALAFTVVLWAARMSMLFSVIRIAPPKCRLRTVANLTAVLFAGSFILLMVQKVYICERNKSWHYTRIEECRLGDGVAIAEICTDFISDGSLVALSLWMLWDVRLPAHERRLIRALFSASILTTLVSVVHTLFVIGPTHLLEGVSANLEAAVSLIVCNLLVVVTFLYRVCLRRWNSDTDESYISSTADLESAMGTTRTGPVHTSDLWGDITRPSDCAPCQTELSSTAFIHREKPMSPEISTLSNSHNPLSPSAELQLASL